MNALAVEHPAGFGRGASLAALAAIVASLSIALPGCGPTDPRITVQGTVSLDGKPLPSGQAVFIPSDTSLGATGAVIKDGRFTILAYKGRSRVEFNSVVPHGASAADAAQGDTPMLRDIIPPLYNEKSSLTVEVQSAKDKPVFNLTSGR